MKKFYLLVTFITCYLMAWSNNVRVDSIVREGANRDIITFRLSWENSWYVTDPPANHDAVWVFIKFRKCNTTLWRHALLSKNMADHETSNAITFARQIDTLDRLGRPCSTCNNGVLIRRANVGTGHVVNQWVRLKVVGATNGDPFLASEEYEIKVFAIEMVYIPSGAFYLGDGGSAARLGNPTTGVPVLITSENSITLRNTGSGYNVTLPDSFPKGFKEFYIMKYEITQGQYVDFLNTCQPYDPYRSYIYSGYMHSMFFSGGLYQTNEPNRAKNFLSFDDLLAYLDWAGLRPMTELEYEKACRGPVEYVPGEYAWGSTIVIEARNFQNTTSGMEVCTNVYANLHYYGWDYYCYGARFGGGNYGPVEVGVFARDTTLSREATGATYYGVMEMSGNVWEQCIQVNVNNNNPSTSSSYSGRWGDGILSTSGQAFEIGWPTSGFFIHKGGSWENGISTSLPSECRVSDRSKRDQTYFSYRYSSVGGRGVR